MDRAALESPLVPRVLDRPGGVLRGKSEPGQFFTEGGRRRPYEFVRWHRSGSYLWDGHTLSWENLRAKPPDESSPVPASTGPPAARTLPEHSRLPSTSRLVALGWLSRTGDRTLRVAPDYDRRIDDWLPLARRPTSH